MTVYEQLEKIRQLLDEGEDRLRGMRDQVDRPAQVIINHAIGQYMEARDTLQKLDATIAQGH